MRSATGRFLAASASKPNPFSKAAVEARGMTVDANNRVVPAVLRGLPQQQADALMMAVAPVMDVLQAQPQVGPDAMSLFLQYRTGVGVQQAECPRGNSVMRC
jgi:hypothetical protein